MKAKFLIGSTIVVIIFGIFGARELIGFTHGSDGNKSTNDNVVEGVRETSEPKLYDEKFRKWALEMNKVLSKPMDNAKLKEANNDEGFEYYLKAQEVIGEFPNQLLKDSKKIEKEHSNLFLLSSYIGHKQFVRTAHLDPNGKMKESTEFIDQWKPTDENIRQAFEYMKEIVNDIDVVVNHKGEGKIYGVTHLNNGDKVSEVEQFLKFN